MSNNNTSKSSEPTIEKCMNILENIPGILGGSDIFNCAVNLLTRKEMQHAFLKLSTDETRKSCLMAGWEGVAHDNRIFGEALRRPELNFSHPSGDKYYLVDVGYSHIKRYMAPYKGDNKYCRANIWGIESKVVYFARYAFFYHYDTQRDIVLATMAIHNYIKKKCKVDNAFQEAENERYVPHVDPDVGRFTRVNVANEENVENQGDNNIWMAIRDLIAQDIYDS
nr:uncharacterized protein LOC104088704 [Nicotiana tomentosiformis]